MVVLQVVRHNISDEYPWPQDVSDLFRRFSRPLPERLMSNEFQNELPPRTREMLQEALHSPGLVLENENEKARPVTDVIETVLSSVRIVRAASAFGRGEEQARFSWTSLITILGITISENVYLAYGIRVSFSLFY